MEDNITVDRLFLQKFAEFTKVVLSELKSLRGQLQDKMSKEAAYDEQQEVYNSTVVKIANALYESDFDFVIDGDRKKFIKNASRNPNLISEAFTKVCKAADVTLLGKPANNVKSNKTANFLDPVYLHAFGNRGSSSVFETDD
jgi:hypothetical protein